MTLEGYWSQEKNIPLHVKSNTVGTPKYILRNTLIKNLIAYILRAHNDEAHLPRIDADHGEFGNKAIKLYTLKIETIVSGQCAALG
jgi:hypothetical protein